MSRRHTVHELPGTPTGAGLDRPYQDAGTALRGEIRATMTVAMAATTTLRISAPSPT